MSKRNMTINQKQALQKGFSLIEIAIVLVIIGLLISGIMKGSELITNARINTAANDVNNYSMALVSYEQRYGNILQRVTTGQSWQEDSAVLLNELSNTGFINPKSQSSLGGPMYLIKNGSTSGSPIGTLGANNLASNGTNRFNWALCYADLTDDSQIQHLIRIIDGDQSYGLGRARLVNNATLVSSSDESFGPDDDHRTLCFEI